LPELVEGKEHVRMKKQWKWYIYILECLDGSYYTGKTWKPELRYDQHISGLGGDYTRKHGVRKLVYIEEHTDFENVSIREKQIQGWTRIKKEKLINGIWKSEW
jgi:putative endonuclease